MGIDISVASGWLKPKSRGDWKAVLKILGRDKIRYIGRAGPRIELRSSTWTGTCKRQDLAKALVNRRKISLQCRLGRETSIEVRAGATYGRPGHTNLTVATDRPKVR